MREDDSKLLDWHVMSEQSADSNDARVKTLSDAAAEDKLHCIHELQVVKKKFHVEAESREMQHAKAGTCTVRACAAFERS